MSETGLRAVLETVMDPEIPVVSVMDLGIVRDIAADKVTITPTYSGCPATDVIERTIREALDANGYREVAIETVLTPPWTTDWISEEGKERLRAYGIAPPELLLAVSPFGEPQPISSSMAAIADPPIKLLVFIAIRILL